MSQINPFVGSIIQTPLAQRQQAAERSAQVRHKQDFKKNSGLQGSDQFEHQVESAEAVTPAHDQERHDRDPKRQGKANDPAGESSDEVKPRIDVTA